MVAPNDLSTDTGVPIPWQDGPPDPVEPALHLVIAWFAGEPDRVGQVACIDRECVLGRVHEEAPGEQLL